MRREARATETKVRHLTVRQDPLASADAPEGFTVIEYLRTEGCEGENHGGRQQRKKGPQRRHLTTRLSRYVFLV